jgi:hypothetical protein
MFDIVVTNGLLSTSCGAASQVSAGGDQGCKRDLWSNVNAAVPSGAKDMNYSNTDYLSNRAFAANSTLLYYWLPMILPVCDTAHERYTYFSHPAEMALIYIHAMQSRLYTISSATIKLLHHAVVHGTNQAPSLPRYRSSHRCTVGAR